MNARVDKIGISRSRLIARTEIINAHKLGKIMEGQALQELLGEEIVYRWKTSGDTVVRPEHVGRNLKYYSFTRVLQLIGEPNCRCAVTVVPNSRVPEGAVINR